MGEGGFPSHPTDRAERRDSGGGGGNSRNAVVQDSSLLLAAGTCGAEPFVSLNPYSAQFDVFGEPGGILH